MGLANLEDLGLVKEDIGLTAPVVTLDYFGPNASPVRYQGVNLGLEEVLLCRKKCLGLSLNENDGLTKNNENDGKEKKGFSIYTYIFLPTHT